MSTIDRSGWGSGPWDGEPDRAEWRAHGFPCLARRNDSGAWCGYVGVPPGHPWHGLGYDAVDEGLVEVHGGLTYSAPCRGAICHVPAPGEPDDVWWLGFDCAHHRDLLPGRRAMARELGLEDHPGEAHEVYRTLDFVRAEVEKLAHAAAEVAGG